MTYFIEVEVENKPWTRTSAPYFGKQFFLKKIWSWLRKEKNILEMTGVTLNNISWLVK